MAYFENVNMHFTFPRLSIIRHFLKLCRW